MMDRGLRHGRRSQAKEVAQAYSVSPLNRITRLTVMEVVTRNTAGPTKWVRVSVQGFRKQLHR